MVTFDHQRASRTNRAATSPPQLLRQSANPVVQRAPTCACGGGCPHCQSKLPLQAKLTVNQPDDKYEQEADCVAEQIMRMPGPEALAGGPTGQPGQPAPIQRVCSECEGELQRQPMEDEEEEEILQTKPLAGPITPLMQRQDGVLDSLGTQSGVSSDPEHRIAALQGRGQPLSQPERIFSNLALA